MRASHSSCVSVAGARVPHSCRRRSSQLQSHVMRHVTASPYPAVTHARNVHKGGSRHCVIPLGGRQLADRESEHCQPDGNPPRLIELEQSVQESGGGCHAAAPRSISLATCAFMVAARSRRAPSTSNWTPAFSSALTRRSSAPTAAGGR